MQSEAPLTLILSPLRAGRGELERTSLGSLFGDPDALPRKVPLSLSKRERVRVRVRLYCLDTAKRSRVVVGPFANAPAFWIFRDVQRRRLPFHNRGKQSKAPSPLRFAGA